MVTVSEFIAVPKMDFVLCRIECLSIIAIVAFVDKAFSVFGALHLSEMPEELLSVDGVDEGDMVSFIN